MHSTRIATNRNDLRTLSLGGPGTLKRQSKQIRWCVCNTVPVEEADLESHWDIEMDKLWDFSAIGADKTWDLMNWVKSGQTAGSHGDI